MDDDLTGDLILPTPPDSATPKPAHSITSTGSTSNAQQAYSAALGEGLSKTAARALVANLAGEGLHVPGDYHWDGTHMARGIAQWDPPRSAAVREKFGTNPNEMGVGDQTRAVIWEINTNPRFAATKAALAGSDPQVMVSTLVNNYEVPADKAKAIADRSRRFNSLTGLSDDPELSLPALPPGPEPTKPAPLFLDDDMQQGYREVDAPKDYSFMDAASHAMRYETSIGQMYGALAAPGFKPESFQWTPEMQSEKLGDLDRSTQEWIRESAVSPAHVDWMRGQSLSRIEGEQALASQGILGAGVALMGVGLLDLPTWVAGGVAGKALQSARQLSRMETIRRGALVGAASYAPIATTRMALDHKYEAGNAAQGFAIAALFGGGLTALGGVGKEYAKRYREIAKPSAGGENSASSGAKGLSADFADGPAPVIKPTSLDRFAKKMGGWLDFSVGGRLYHSKNDAVSELAPKLATIATQDLTAGGRVEESALDFVRRMEATNNSRVMSSMQKWHKPWADAKGLSAWDHYKSRDDFWREAMDVHVDPSVNMRDVDPNVAGFVGDMRDILAEHLETGKAYGVERMENLERNDHYLPRYFQPLRWRALRGQHGQEGLESVVEQAILAGDPDIARRVGKRIVERASARDAEQAAAHRYTVDPETGAKVLDQSTPRAKLEAEARVQRDAEIKDAIATSKNLAEANQKLVDVLKKDLLAQVDQEAQQKVGQKRLEGPDSLPAEVPATGDARVTLDSVRESVRREIAHWIEQEQALREESKKLPKVAKDARRRLLQDADDIKDFHSKLEAAAEDAWAEAESRFGPLEEEPSVAVRGGSYELRHGLNDVNSQEFAKTGNWEFSSQFKGERFDEDGGVFGDAGIYLDNHGAWTNNSGFLDKWKVGEVLRVEFSPKNALLVSPETLGTLRGKLGLAEGGLITPEAILSLAKKGKHDAIIVQDFFSVEEDIARSYGVEVRGQYSEAAKPSNIINPERLTPSDREALAAYFTHMHAEAESAQPLEQYLQQFTREEVTPSSVMRARLWQMGIHDEAAQDQVFVKDLRTVKVLGSAATDGAFGGVKFEASAPPAGKRAAKMVQAEARIERDVRKASIKEKAKQAQEGVEESLKAKRDAQIAGSKERAKQTIADQITALKQREFVEVFDKHMAKFEDKFVRRVARKYVETVNDSVEGVRPDIDRALSVRDTELLRDALIKQGIVVDADVADALADLIAPRANRGPTNLRRRTVLDEVTPFTPNGAKAEDAFSLRDLMEYDYERIMGRYTRSMAPHYIMAKHGFQTESAARKYIADVVTQFKGIDGYGDRAAYLDGKRADYLLDHIYGHDPLRRVDPKYRAMAQILGQLSYMRLGGSFGMSQVYDSAELVLRHGFEGFQRGMPAWEEVVSAVKKGGAFADETVRDLQIYAGIGVKGQEARLVPKFQDLDQELADSITGTTMLKALRTSKGLANAVGHMSGLNVMTDVQQFAGARIFLQTIADVSRGIRKNVNERVMLDAGLSQENLKKFWNVLQHATYDENGIIEKLNTDLMRKVDLEAFDHMMGLTRREAHRIILEPNPGLLPMWAGRSPTGKLVSQLKTFSMASHATHSLGNMRLGPTYVAKSVLGGAAWSFMVYTMWTHARALGRSKEERAEFMERSFAPDKLAFNVWSRMGVAGIGPEVIGAGIAVRQRLWPQLDDQGRSLENFYGASARASGLAPGAISSIPVANMVGALLDTIGTGIDTARTGRGWTRGEVRKGLSLLPLQNALVVSQGISRATTHMPQKKAETR